MRKRFYNRDVISILDFSRDELLYLFEVARDMEKYSKAKIDLLKDKILALAFFEPSTRTMFSFQTAMNRLGGAVLSFSRTESTSLAKGENLADTIRMLDSYSNAIVIRHKFEGAAKYAAEIAKSPVINAGDGTQHHPTQAMIDLFTIWKIQGDLRNLTIGVLGDLRYGRAATSFIYAISKFNPRKLYLISPNILRLREEVLDHLDRNNVNYDENVNLKEVICELDILYVTRIQRERFPDPSEYEKVKGSYRLESKMLKDVKDNLIILHPLPRVDEISFDVDNTKYACYFKQAYYGVPVRMALLSLILGDVDDE